VSLLPVALFVMLYFLNRTYLQPLWQETLGKLALVVSALLITSGSLIIKKIVDIEP
jgi:Flp pilus assembly protein TadB